MDFYLLDVSVCNGECGHRIYVAKAGGDITEDDIRKSVQCQLGFSLDDPAHSGIPAERVIGICFDGEKHDYPFEEPTEYMVKVQRRGTIMRNEMELFDRMLPVGKIIKIESRDEMV